MSELLYDRLKENLESLKMRNTLEILDNYLERAIKDELNIVDVLDHIFSEEARNKRQRAYEKQIQMSGFPIKKGLDDFDFSFQPSIDKRQIDELATMRFVENVENIVFLGPPSVGKTHLANALGMVAAKNRYSTYYINCHALIEQLKKAISRIDSLTSSELSLNTRFSSLMKSAICLWIFKVQIYSFSSSLNDTKRLLLSSLPTKPFPSGTRSLPMSPLHQPYLTVCFITPLSSTSRARATALKSAKSI